MTDPAATDPAATDGIAARYRAFAHQQAHGVSPLYERLALGVAADPDLLALLAPLPPVKQQPNLLFAAARLLAGVPESFEAFRAVVLDRRDEVTATMLARATQTNEPARCAQLLPLLASLPQPLALLEVGASAGLCLLPDRYHYTYASGPLESEIGDPDSPVRLRCNVTGDGPPPGPIEVAWRGGIDLNPLDPTDPDDVRWLETLVWPEHHERASRLRAALTIAAADPPKIVRGDLVDTLPALAATVPPGATLVVFDSNVLSYLPADRRDAFASLARDLPGHWIAQEGVGVVQPVPANVPPRVPDGRAEMLLTLDGRARALTAPHGGEIRWLPAPDRSAFSEGRFVGPA